MTALLVRLAAVVALLAVLFFGEQYIEGRGYDRAKAEDQAEANKLKAKASLTLAAETARANAAEHKLQANTDSQNLKDRDHEKTVANLSDRLRRAAGPAGRLRDPYATGCGAGSSGATGEAPGAPGDRPADGSETGGLLSADLTGLFQRLTREADDINTAYASCRADAFAVRKYPDDRSDRPD